MTTYAVTVGVALTRPPAIHEYRRYIVTADSPLAASLLATQWAAATCEMPVYSSHPEELQ